MVIQATGNSSKCLLTGVRSMQSLNTYALYQLANRRDTLYHTQTKTNGPLFDEAQHALCARSQKLCQLFKYITDIAN